MFCKFVNTLCIISKISAIYIWMIATLLVIFGDFLFNYQKNPRLNLVSEQNCLLRNHKRTVNTGLCALKLWNAPFEIFFLCQVRRWLRCLPFNVNTLVGGNKTVITLSEILSELLWKLNGGSTYDNWFGGEKVYELFIYEVIK